MRPRPSDPFDLRSSPRLLPAGALAVLLLFLFAVELLGAATDAGAPLLERVFFRVAGADASALGLGWLGAYVLASGTVVAAVALSLFAAGVVSASQLFLLIAGSRLGAAAIVVFVGVLDYLQEDRRSLQRSVNMGLLAMLLTHSVYVPVTVLGYVSLPYLRDPFGTVGRSWSLGFRPLSFLDPLTVAITNRIGPVPSVLLAVGVLYGSLRLFDRVLANVGTETLRRRVFRHFRHPWLSFGIGLAVTGLTTSVAFSLGIVVPLYNRGYVERDELLPYVLGANLGTLVDTLVVAVLLGSTTGVAVALVFLVLATLLTLAALVAYGGYGRLVSAVDDRLLTDRRAFVGFVLSLLLVPLALLLVPLALA